MFSLQMTTKLQNYTLDKKYQKVEFHGAVILWKGKSLAFNNQSCQTETAHHTEAMQGVQNSFVWKNICDLQAWT